MVAFLSGAVLTAANLNSAFNTLTFRAVTGTSDTFVLADNGGAVSYSNASAITATVPPFSSVAYANGTVIQLLNLGAGVVTVTAGVGVTLNGSIVTLAQNAGGTLIKTATNTWYFLPSSSGSGMDLITPTSVAGTGVTLSGGQVNFSASTAISVNGCFTSAYDNYLLAWDVISASAAGWTQVRLRLSGTDAATAYLSATVFSSFNTDTGGFIGTSFGTTYAVLGYSDTTGSAAAVNVFAPAIARKTIFLGGSPNIPSNGNARFAQAVHTTATAYDGFSVIPQSGNITGNLRVYGLRNS